MAKYSVSICRSAVRELEVLPGSERRRVLRRIRRLGSDVRPPDSERLSVLEKYRLRVGLCRLAYGVDDEARTVWVVKVGQRPECVEAKPFQG